MSLFRICYFLKKLKKIERGGGRSRWALYWSFWCILYRWASPPFAMGEPNWTHTMCDAIRICSMGDTMIEMILVIIALLESVIVTKTIGIVGIAAIVAMNTVKGKEPIRTDKAWYKMRVLDYLNGIMNIMDNIHANGWTKYQTMTIGVQYAKVELVLVRAMLKAYLAMAKVQNWTLAVDVCPNTASSPVAKLNAMIATLIDMSMTDDEKNAMLISQLEKQMAKDAKALKALLAKGKGGAGKKE